MLIYAPVEEVPPSSEELSELADSLKANNIRPEDVTRFYKVQRDKFSGKLYLIPNE